MPIVAAALAALGVFGMAPAGAAPATQVRLSADRGAVDMGVAPSAQLKSITLSLSIVNRPALERFIQSTTDRSSPNFRKFLTPAQFAASYGQTPEAVARVRSFLSANGIQVTKVYSNNLVMNAKATNAQLAQVFGSPIHKFSFRGATHQRPVGAVKLPVELRGVVAGVAGLSTQGLRRPMLARIPNTGAAAKEASVSPIRVPRPGATANAILGQLTVFDVADRYNVNPLYARGLTGKGRTIGILTYAKFDPADAYAYWDALGLSYEPNRVSVVTIGDLADISDNGAEETTLDVQQSGGMAPGARVVVYQAPNDGAHDIDLFATAVEANLADTLSMSWGLFEIAYDPLLDLAGYDPVLLQAAAQGIPITASAGDAGAYEINRYGYGYEYPGCTTLLTVGFPASHPFILAAGGTTLPGVIQRRYGTVTVPAERAWSWDYFRDYYVRWYGQAVYYADAFPVGDGGGVSVNYDAPPWQTGLPGVKTSASAQALFCNNPAGGVSYLAYLPGGYAGRNLPDVSLNADPFTGYLFYFGGNWYQGNGGTSFVAPQLNGIFALISEQLGGRVGFPATQLYAAFKKQGYGAGSPLRPVVYGSNLFYNASSAGFNPATGLGTLDVDNLSKVLAAP